MTNKKNEIMRDTITVEFVSIWNQEREISSNAKLRLSTGTVFDVDFTDENIGDCEILTGEYIRHDSFLKDIEVEESTENSYVVSLDDLSRLVRYSVFAVSDGGTQTIESNLTRGRAIALVQNLRYQLKNKKYINHTDLDEVSDFAFDLL